MARAKIELKKIVALAVEITEERGIEAITLKEISKKLNVSSPSLYNHVGNLADLKAKVSYHALEMVKESLLKAALGKSGADIFRAIGKAYIHFAQEHPHLYEIIQWMNVWDDVTGKTVFSDLMRLSWKSCAEMGMGEAEANHIIRSLRSLVHGFASIESHHGFGYEASVQDSFEYALDIFVLGMKNRYYPDSQPRID